MPRIARRGTDPPVLAAFAYHVCCRLSLSIVPPLAGIPRKSSFSVSHMALSVVPVLFYTLAAEPQVFLPQLFA
ncbi:MAG: hypothetical protein EOQ92_18725 [Mesorhizobium sp.]|uniref:hypothetical protein n=1 Tax=Mesorhizobium sp. TaxID=1871066 RepID=UPI000FE6760A|nr:hypothetical protein [Mesorhizobium sp.]RWI22033.1 MAG: hypothetical protein EOQ92_18725 [Mesorhizobium sp.]RWK46080.1 MAG: hypothetical protein EOR47_27625 [Mesorhizobium sp.]RWK92319.1 MAG: hypothetical protein EOR53_26755 [Mesorhizobium sp.]TIP57777.1 MAG: hypothetical protein E5X56_18465 [Mesorhizobium sp.]TIQ21776.1 MAG: hypothetical protein E5X51_09300 [Mesorhizobium sp.]